MRTRLASGVVLALVLSMSIPTIALADDGSTSLLKSTGTLTWSKPGGAKTGLAPAGIDPGAAGLTCSGNSNDAPHPSGHFPGTVSATGVTQCTAPVARISATGYLYKQVLFFFWQEMNSDPISNASWFLAESHPNTPCDGAQTYKLETDHYVLTFDGLVGTLRTASPVRDVTCVP